MEPYYILNHLGEEREDYFNAVTPPIFQSSNFCFKNVEALRNGLKNEFETPFYTRGFNPTVGILRKKIAALEKAEDALIFSSGSAAISAAVISSVKQGDHVICVKKPYSWTNHLLTHLLAKFGVECSMVDGREIINFENAIRKNTTLIYLESPNSMTFEMQDLEAVAILAKKNKITTICDNSYASPINQNPITLGIDIVVHSATKFISGHSDVVAGVICSTKEKIKKIFEQEFMTLGATLSPNDAWLLIKGLRTLPIRVKQVTENSFKVLHFLETHPKIEKIYFPFSEKNTQISLAKKQMKPCGGLISIELKVDNIAAVERFCNHLKYFIIACSWGGYESLQFPICALYNSENYTTELPWNFVRLYIGLEDADVLIEDLKQALEKM
ncbi:MAG: aminotransferase class I/II-fold pyridoxal phosphate-dependent enzyme [Flavobacteriales bacterium]|nr:aminotransferase class I/II-fold pyridoxal phosphate-dependent enzyme [Flavobacteriales bacterium]